MGGSGSCWEGCMMYPVALALRFNPSVSQGFVVFFFLSLSCEHGHGLGHTNAQRAAHGGTGSPARMHTAKFVEERRDDRSRRVQRACNFDTVQLLNACRIKTAAVAVCPPPPRSQYTRLYLHARRDAIKHGNKGHLHKFIRQM